MPDDPAEIGQNRVLTREPDTASTVGGKDAYMGYARGIALHLDGFAMRFFVLAPFCREFHRDSGSFASILRSKPLKDIQYSCRLAACLEAKSLAVP